MPQRLRVTAAAAVLALALTTAAAHARDCFLTIGGGYNPSGNQVSLEKNVHYFQRLLADFGHAEDPHAIFFADGGRPGRDLQFRDPGFDIPKANLLLARLTKQTNGLWDQYRSSDIPRLTGPSSVSELDKWFDSTGANLTAADRLFIYATAHGGKGDNKEKDDTKLYLWNNQHIKASDFVKRLDKLPKELPVVLVMVQCYSGGFANIVFNEADAEKGVSEHDRCGFYATVHTRPAAGCTPDIDEANYHEFSTYFWEAMFGENRLGESIERPDYDGDGKTSFAEAHAYVMLHSDTIDIPVKTSDAILRAFSRTEHEKPEEKKDGEGNAEADQKPELLTPDADYNALLEPASLIDRAVMDGLSRTLGLDRPDRAKQARDLADEIEKQRKELAAEKSKLAKEHDNLRKGLLTYVRNRWPEIENAWHPKTRDVLADEADAVVKMIENNRAYKKMCELEEKQDEIETQRRDLERKWVKTQRFLRVAENIALATNLVKVATDEQQRHYLAMLQREAGTLPITTPVTRAAAKGEGETATQ